MMDVVTGDGKATLFWVGLPPMRNTERYETRYQIINDIVKSEARAASAASCSSTRARR